MKSFVFTVLTVSSLIAIVASFSLRSNDVHISKTENYEHKKERHVDNTIIPVSAQKEFDVLHWGGRDNFRCPTRNGAFPDPKDCSKYYVCSQGRSSHKNCNRNMLFDVHRRTCLPRWIAVCRDGKDGSTAKPIATPETGVTENDKDFKCNDLYGTYAHPTKCEKYYTCIFYSSTLRTCPESQLFDAIKKKCLDENEVNCGSREKPFVPSTTEKIVSRSEETTPTFEITETFSTSELIITELETTTVKITVEDTTTSLDETTPTTVRETTESTTEESTTSVTETTPTTERETTETTTEESTASVADTTPTREREVTESTTEESTTSVTETTPTTETETTETTTEESTSSVAETSTTEREITETTTEELITTSKPTGPPDTDCDEDDVDCIIKETGEVSDWFTCPQDIGSYKHPSSNKLFIFCINWKPSVKRCGQDLVFSTELSTCIRPE